MDTFNDYTDRPKDEHVWQAEELHDIPAKSRAFQAVAEALQRAAQFAFEEANKPATDMFGAAPRATRQDVLNKLKGENDGNQRAGQENLEERGRRQPDARDVGHQADDGARPADAGAAQADRADDSRADAQPANSRGQRIIRNDATQTARKSRAAPQRGNTGEGAAFASGIPRGLPAAPNADTAKLEQRINRWLAAKGRQGGWRANRVSAVSLPDALNHAVDRFHDATGTRVVLFRNFTPEIDDFNGVNFGDGVVYINENSQNPATLTAVHEWLHNIRRTHPLLYEALAQEVARQGDLPGYQQHLRRSKETRWRVPDVVVEELTAASVAASAQGAEY